MAEANRPRILFENSLPPSYYFPPEDVRTDLLVESETETVYPYKGVASHWSAEVGDERVEDAAWGYPKAQKEGHFCFYASGAELEVDGERQG